MLKAPGQQVNQLPNARLSAPNALPSAPQSTISSGNTAPQVGRPSVGGEMQLATGSAFAPVAQRMQEISLKLFEKAQDKANETQLTEFSNKLNAWYMENVLHPEHGISQVKGDKALGLTDEIGAKFKAYYDTEIGSMPDHLRVKAGILAKSTEGQIGLTVAKYSGEQLSAYEAKETNSFFVLQRALAAKDPDNTGQSVMLADQKLEQMYGNGEITQSELELRKGEFRAGIAFDQATEAMGNERYGEATAILKGPLGDFVDPVTKARMLESAYTAQKEKYISSVANTAANSFIPKNFVGNADMDGAVTSIRATISDPDAADQAIAMFAHKMNIWEQGRNRFHTQLENNVYAVFNATGGDAGAAMKEATNLPAEIQHKISNTLAVSLERQAKAARNVAEKKKQTRMREVTMSSMLANIQNVTPESLAKDIATGAVDKEAGERLQKILPAIQTPEAQEAYKLIHTATAVQDSPRDPSWWEATTDTVAHAAYWFNDTVNPWSDMTDGKGFSITPSQARVLHEKLTTAVIAGEKDPTRYAKEEIERVVADDHKSFVLETLSIAAHDPNSYIGSTLAGEGYAAVQDMLSSEEGDKLGAFYKKRAVEVNIQGYAEQGYIIRFDPNYNTIIASDGLNAFDVATGKQVDIHKTADALYSQIASVIGGDAIVEVGNKPTRSFPIHAWPDGSVSTVRTISVEIENGYEALIPTIGMKPDHTTYVMTDQEAIDLFIQTNKHYGIYRNTASADMAGQALHLYHEALLKVREGNK